jgi:hypothetical protein
MHCATSRKVAVSIPDFTRSLGFIPPLTEMSTRNISWEGEEMRPTRRADSLPIVLKSGSLNLLEPSGPVQGCTGMALPLFLKHIFVRTTGIHFLHGAECFLTS